MAVAEVVVYLSILGGALAAVWRLGLRQRAHGRRTIALVLLGVGQLGVLGALAWRPSVAAPRAVPTLSELEDGSQWAGSHACRSCHPEAYTSWHRSFHRSMTERATPSTVRAPFDGQRLEWRGQAYALSRRGAEHWVTLPDPDLAAAAARRGQDPDRLDLPRVERQIVMTTGSHHYQAYWLRGQRGLELYQLPFVFHLGSARWLPRDAAFLQPPDAIRRSTRWNSNCIQCHSVAGAPRHDPASDRFETRAAELGIACEACHGPARAHVEKQQNPLTRYAARLRGAADPSIVNPKRLPAERASEVCGQCHAYFVPRDETRWWRDGFSESYRPGEVLAASRLVLDYSTERARPNALIDAELESIFWPDGTVRVGGREYNGLLRSPCFEHGQDANKLSCLSCHSMHQSDPDDQLGRDKHGNAACSNCHAELSARVAAHSHHPPESSGSLCYACHMPRTSYALFKAIRSHRIQTPQTSASGPNACTLCHLDRSRSWSARWLHEWYGQPRLEPSSDPSDATDPNDAVTSDTADSLVQLLSGNAAERAIWAHAFGQAEARAVSGSAWMAPFLAELLDDPYAAVRWIAARSLAGLPPSERAGFELGDYDFLAASAERRQHRARVQRRWRETSGVRARSELLLSTDGNVDLDAAAALSARRDERPITISE